MTRKRATVIGKEYKEWNEIKGPIKPIIYNEDDTSREVNLNYQNRNIFIESSGIRIA